MSTGSVTICAVYKSEVVDQMYLFVDQQEAFERVPEEFMKNFPNPVLVTQFKLFPERQLARVDAKKLIALSLIHI